MSRDSARPWSFLRLRQGGSTQHTRGELRQRSDGLALRGCLRARLGRVMRRDVAFPKGERTALRAPLRVWLHTVSGLWAQFGRTGAPHSCHNNRRTLIANTLLHVFLSAVMSIPCIMPTFLNPRARWWEATRR